MDAQIFVLHPAALLRANFHPDPVSFSSRNDCFARPNRYTQVAYDLRVNGDACDDLYFLT